MTRSPGSDSEAPFVSVLLPVRNERVELLECLAAIAAQTYPKHSFEVILADASDVTLDRRDLPVALDLTIVRNTERLMSRGLNLAARHARGSYFAVVSAHSVIPSDYLEKMVRSADETGAANIGTRIRKVARSATGRAIAAATSSPLGVGGGVQHHGDRPGTADSAFPGFIERRAFDELTGFNPTLACNEDDEFNARLRASGGTVWFEPTVEVTYRPRETLGGLARQQFRYGRWKVAVARLGVIGYLRPYHLIPATAVASAAALSLASLVWPAPRALMVTGGAAYAVLTAIEARRIASGFGADPWRVAAAFPVIHASYGLGFIRGLLDRGLPVERQHGTAPAIGEGS